MRVVLQRVKRAKCTVDGVITGEIKRGYALLLGIHNSDTKEIADKMIEKIKNLRIFEDENGKTNLNIEAVQGGILLIPQFTLYADCKKGNRPNFLEAAKPEMANEMFIYMYDGFKNHFENIGKGVFGADMEIELVNDGPFTLNLDSETLKF